MPKIVWIACLSCLAFVWAPQEVMAQQYPTSSGADEESENESDNEPVEQQDMGRPPVADRAEEEQEAFERRGFWAHLGLGYGSLGNDEDDERLDGGAGGLVLGGSITPRFLLGGASHAWTRTEDDVTLTVGTVTPILRFYPLVDDHFFVQAGIGFGAISLEFPGVRFSEEGGGAIVGIGYDFLIGDTWGITPFANMAGVVTSEIDANFFQLGAGVTWH